LFRNIKSNIVATCSLIGMNNLVKSPLAQLKGMLLRYVTQ